MRHTISKVGLLFSGGFIALAAVAWIWHVWSSVNNTANSGETGIIMLLFTFPWFGLVEARSEAAMWIMVGFNALLLYFFGALVGWVAVSIKRFL